LRTLESNDPEFDEYCRAFETMEMAIEALLKDSKVFADAVVSEYSLMLRGKMSRAGRILIGYHSVT